jgi:glyoxylase-like metal-dependent hydrolase (beta-lactamase superfamily II)
MQKPIFRVIFIALFMVFGIGAASYTQPQEAEPVKLEMVSEGLYQILGGRGANGGCFIGDNGVLVIDAKMDQTSVEQTLSEIRKLTDLPVTYLVNTHSDGDHVYGNRFFPKEVVIMAHCNCRKEFFHPRRDGEPSEWNNPELAVFVPEVTYHKMMTIHMGDKKAQLWYFGVGHTTGDTVVYFPDAKTAFLGDQIFTGRPQLIHAYKGGNSFKHVKALSKMLAVLEAETFCSGHSRPLTRDDIEQHIAGMKDMQQKITKMVNEGMGLEEIKKQFEENQARLVEVIYNEVNSS